MRLVCHVLQAFASGRVVVIAAEPGEFGAGATIFTQVECARRCLPLTFRRTCIAKVFTRTPIRYLEAGANLLAVPSDTVESLVRSGTDMVVLDFLLERVDGQAVASAAEKYGRFVRDCLAKYQTIGEQWLDRADHIFLHRRLPSDVEIELACDLSDAPLGSELHLRSEWRGLPLKWSSLIGPPDLRRMHPSTLVELALNRNWSPGWDTLRPLAVDELVRSTCGWSKLKAFGFDHYLREDAPATVNLLLVTGSWGGWRDETGCSPQELREAAIAWMESPHWDTSEPFLEDWICCARDYLQDAALVGGAGSDQGRPGPVIEWIESRQARAWSDLLKGNPEPTEPVPEGQLIHGPQARILPAVQDADIGVADGSKDVGADDDAGMAARELHSTLSEDPSPEGETAGPFHPGWVRMAIAALIGFIAGVLATLLWKRH